MIRLKMQMRGQAFQNARRQFTSPAASGEVLGICGALLDRRAKMGARSVIGGNFGDQIARSVSHEHTEKTLTVGATHYAASHKQEGGKISAPGKGPGATGAKMLAIPIDPAAKGKSPREVNGLFLLISKEGKGKAFLAKDDGLGGLTMMFVLIKSVKQRKYPWFPVGKKAQEEIDKGIKFWLSRQSS